MSPDQMYHPKIGDIFYSYLGGDHDKTDLFFYVVKEIFSDGNLKFQQLESVEDMSKKRPGSKYLFPNAALPTMTPLIKAPLEIEKDGHPIVKITNYAVAHLWNEEPMFQKEEHHLDHHY